jgi:CrcB protein
LYRILLVGIGGFLGSAMRYIISGWAVKAFEDYIPYGTLLVNVIGCFFMGFIMEVSVEIWPTSSELRVFLTTGLIGGFTTFSAFSYETMSLFSDGSIILAGANVFLNLLLGCTAVWLGKSIAQLLA